MNQLPYADFIASKALTHTSTGIEKPDKLNAALFDFQADITRWMLKKGRAACFAGTGLGKTAMQCEVAKHVEKSTKMPVLIFAPLAVSHQTIEEAHKILGINVTFAKSQEDVGGRGIYITNYGKMHLFDPTQFGGVILDECFPKGTRVECIENGILLKREIQDIQEGDEIINASGVDRVTECHRRKIICAVKITLCDGKTIIASENHPFFTQDGWMPAKNIQGKTMRLMETAEAMRMVQNDICPKERNGKQVLREILLSEMENESTGAQSEGSHCGDSREDQCQEQNMAQRQYGVSNSRARSHQSSKSDDSARSPRESEPDIASDEAQTFRAWGQWEADDRAAIISLGGIIERVGARVCRISGATNGRLSNLLQAGFSKSNNEDRNRSGRIQPSFTQGTRQEKGCEIGFVGVESVEILEQGHPELERFRNADGNIYFYDLKASRHPSFSVEGILVHNSSCLKSEDAKTRTKLCEDYANVPFRYAFTATPAPNDFMEIGGHAEFLGVMSKSEMFSTFFVHDGGETQKWRLKGHAEKDFWQWIASWCVVCTHPRDLGYEDARYDLPPLNIKEVFVESPSGEDENGQGQLLPTMARGLKERRGARRNSIDLRIAAAAEIANASEDMFNVWCNLNDEGEGLTKAITGAVEVAGRHEDEYKEKTLLAFAHGEIRALVSKAKLAGWGMNFQRCHNIIYFPDDSFEAWFQAVRRNYRFGQTETVNVWMVLSESERPIFENLKRKEKEAMRMYAELVGHMAEISKANIKASAGRTKLEYTPKKQMNLPEWLKSEIQ